MEYKLLKCSPRRGKMNAQYIPLCLFQERHFGIARRKFSKVQNRRFWEKPTYDFLDSVINRIEFKYGRLSPLIVESEDTFLKEEKSILITIENMEHPRYFFVFIYLAELLTGVYYILSNFDTMFSLKIGHNLYFAEFLYWVRERKVEG